MRARGRLCYTALLVLARLTSCSGLPRDGARLVSPSTFCYVPLMTYVTDRGSHRIVREATSTEEEMVKEINRWVPTVLPIVSDHVCSQRDPMKPFGAEYSMLLGGALECRCIQCDEVLATRGRAELFRR